MRSSFVFSHLFQQKNDSIDYLKFYVYSSFEAVQQIVTFSDQILIFSVTQLRPIFYTSSPKKHYKIQS